MLDLQRLRIFRSVVASGSIQAAATHLGFSPSAVSQQVATLQREVGVALTEKSGRGIVPTAAGIALASESDEIIDNLARLTALIDDLRDGRTGRLTIGYFTSAGAAWMPEIARVISTEFPQVVLELTLNELLDDRAPRQVDLDIVAEPLSTSSLPTPGYRRRALIDDPYVVVLPIDHPLADHSVIALGDLANETWVSNDFSYSTCTRIVLDACKAAGYAPRFSVQAQDHHTAIAFVEKGVGITVLPRLAAMVLPAGTRAIPLVDPEPVRRISLLTRESSLGTPAASAATRVLDQLTGPRQSVGALAAVSVGQL